MKNEKPNKKENQEILIVSKKRVKNLAEVYTAKREVVSILNLIPQEIWENNNSTFLEPSCGNGNFIEAIILKKIKNLNINKNQQQLEFDILNAVCHIYGIDICFENIKTCKNRIFKLIKKYFYDIYNHLIPTEKFLTTLEYIIDLNYICNDTLKNSENICFIKWKFSINLDCKEKIFKLSELLKSDKKQLNFSFDVIVGNPPYQLKDGGYGASASPLYHLFVNQAKDLNPKYLSMIIPARWYAGGKNLDKFRNDMIQDKKISYLVDFTDSNDCFPGVEIKGGICYFLWDRNYHGDCTVINFNHKKEIKLKRKLNEYPVFVRFNSSISILKKIKNVNENNLSNKVLGRNVFDLSTNFTDFRQHKTKNDILIYARNTKGYIEKSIVKKNIELIEKYKVIIPKAGEGTGKFPNRIIGKPILTDKNSCCTETYLVIGSFDSILKAKNLYTYLNTKFVRFLIGLIKSTQDTTKDKFLFVPDLTMDEKWTNKKLYIKYGLNKQEIDFIELMIKDHEVK